MIKNIETAFYFVLGLIAISVIASFPASVIVYIWTGNEFASRVALSCGVVISFFYFGDGALKDRK